MDKRKQKRIPVLKFMNRRKILAEIRNVEGVLEKINTNNIIESNNLIYSAAGVVSENLWIKVWRSKKDKEPW